MTGAPTRGSLSYSQKSNDLKPLKVDRTKLITPSAYAKKIGVTHAAVTKMMDTERVTVIEIKGGRIILED